MGGSSGGKRWYADEQEYVFVELVVLCGLIIVVILFEKLEEIVAHWSENHSSKNKKAGLLKGRLGTTSSSKEDGDHHTAGTGAVYDLRC